MEKRSTTSWIRYSRQSFYYLSIVIYHHLLKITLTLSDGKFATVFVSTWSFIESLKSEGLTVRFLWFQYLVNVLLGFLGIRNFSSIFIIIVIITIHIYIFLCLGRNKEHPPTTPPTPPQKKYKIWEFLNKRIKTRHVKRACLAGA